MVRGGIPKDKHILAYEERKEELELKLESK